MASIRLAVDGIYLFVIKLLFTNILFKKKKIGSSALRYSEKLHFQAVTVYYLAVELLLPRNCLFFHQTIIILV